MFIHFSLTQRENNRLPCRSWGCGWIECPHHLWTIWGHSWWTVAWWQMMCLTLSCAVSHWSERCPCTETHLTLFSLYNILSFVGHMISLHVLLNIVSYFYNWNLWYKYIELTRGEPDNSLSWYFVHGRLQLKYDGTRWCTVGEVKGKLANWVGSQYPSHYFGTWCIQHYYQQ